MFLFTILDLKIMYSYVIEVVNTVFTLMLFYIVLHGKT